MEFKIFETPNIKTPFSFSSSVDVYDKMKNYQKSSREIFLILFLDAKNNCLKIEPHAIGTLDTSAVYPREIIKSALLGDSSSLIFVHNHPSGDPEPSTSDNGITKRLLLASHLFEIKVLDHIILGNGRYYSYADEGKIQDYEKELDEKFSLLVKRDVIPVKLKTLLQT